MSDPKNPMIKIQLTLAEASLILTDMVQAPYGQVRDIFPGIEQELQNKFAQVPQEKQGEARDVELPVRAVAFIQQRLSAHPWISVDRFMQASSELMRAYAAEQADTEQVAS